MQNTRLVKVDQAAAYCGLSVAAFKAWLRRMKLRVKVKGANIYDLQALDFALNRMNGITEKVQMPETSFLADMKKVNRNATIPQRHKRH